MAINLLLSCLSWINTLTLSFFINFFFVKNGPYSNVLDLYSRAYLNEGYVSLFYFFWTSSWYLPLAYLTLITITYCFLSTKFLNNLHTLSILIFLTFNYLEFMEYFFLDLSSSYTVMGSELVNNLLTNSINKYHPLLFYISTIQLFKFLGTGLKLYSPPKSEILVIILTLSLGSWWALQEGSWGGWWNWDPSEVFGLVVMLNTILAGHYSLRTLSVYLSIRNRIVTSLTISLIYVFIQLNFDIVSHNFGTNVITYVSSLTFLLLLSCTTLLLGISAYWVTNNQFISNFLLLPKFFYNQTTSGGSGFSNLVSLLPNTYITAIVLVLITSSFSLLVNDFLWNFLVINTLNYVIDYPITVVLVTLVVLFAIWDLHYAATSTYISFYLHQPYLLLLMPAIRFRLSFATLVHLVIFLSLAANAALVINTLTHWVPLWESFAPEPLDIPSHQNVSIGLNSFNLVITPNNLLQNFCTEYSYGFVGLGSSSEIHMFTHTLTLNNLTQELFVGNVLARSSVNVLSFDLNSVTVLLLLSLTYLHLIFFSNSVIVF